MSSKSNALISAPRESSFKRDLTNWTLGVLGAIFIKLMSCTYRWETVYPNPEMSNWSAGDPLIFAFWHGQQLFMARSYLGTPRKNRKPGAVLISEHSDGRIVATSMSLLGIGSIMGSSSNGGSRAFRRLLLHLKSGKHIGITPDGPRGPIYEVKDGVIKLASMSGAKILPAAIRAKSRWTLKSWDRMFIPKPFSKVSLYFGNYIEVPRELRDGEMESYCQQLKQALQTLSDPEVP